MTSPKWSAAPSCGPCRFGSSRKRDRYRNRALNNLGVAAPNVKAFVVPLNMAAISFLSAMTPAGPYTLPVGWPSEARGVT